MNDKKKDDKANGGGRAGDASVLQRANRMARAKLKPLAEALGLPSDFKLEQLEEHVGKIKADREAGMGDEEKRKAVEDGLRRQVAGLQGKLDASELRASRLAEQVTALQGEKEELAGQVEATKADAEITVAAINAGLVDTDYGKELLRREIAKLTEDPPEGYVSKFFEGLKKDPSRAHLFKEVTVPAGPTRERPPEGTTGNAPAATVVAGEAPRAPVAPKPEGGNKSPDVSKMSKPEFSRHLRETHGFVAG